jgi:2-haloacid dehalogenase
MSSSLDVRALAFDVFGTTVDWCASIAREAKAALAPKGHDLDWLAVANRWRRDYHLVMGPVRDGTRAYVTMDQLHREMLDDVLAEFGVSNLSDAGKDDLAHGWRRLDPWPDAVSGLARLRQTRIVAALSNANIALAVAMAKRAGLPWDVILGAELVQTYKPAPAVYDSAPRYLELTPRQVMMVACHVHDLRAAAKRGLRTAFVFRPDEYGPGVGGAPPKPGEFDIVAGDFLELADILDRS